MTMTFASAKNAKITCVCTKLHNYVICESKEAVSDHGTGGVFYGDVVDSQCYGICKGLYCVLCTDGR